MTIFKLSAMV